MKNNKKAKMITLLLGASFVFGACGTTQAETIATTNNATSSVVSSTEAASSSNVAASSSSQANALTFTLDELAQYDGKNGNDAYVAVDGIVYDVTNVAKWQSGSHYGVQAGTDCTTAISVLRMVPLFWMGYQLPGHWWDNPQNLIFNSIPIGKRKTDQGLNMPSSVFLMF